MTGACLGPVVSLSVTRKLEIYGSPRTTKQAIMIIKHSLTFCMAVLTTSSTALLMSDLPTPSLVIDMQAMQRYVDTSTGQKSSPIPPFTLSDDRGVLRPCEIASEQSHIFDCKAPPIRIGDAHNIEAFCYLHSSVVRAREEAMEGHDDPISTFLAEIDLTPSLCGSAGAPELVLGLNNHHVGSYYWARSAGSGASMEAPGVLVAMKGDRGSLRWKKQGGPSVCNSNDGKRSEWVNFLRAGDTIQLLPFVVDDAILCMSASKGNSKFIFGVSSKNRPLGSEPKVVCEWRLQLQES